MNMRKTLTKIGVIAIALGGMLGSSAGRAEDLVSPTEAAKEYFQTYLNQCGANEIRCLWFLQNDPRIGMVMTINLQDGNVFIERDVYNWAHQSSSTHRLTDAQLLTLKEIATNLPPSDLRPSDKNIDFQRAVFVAMRNAGATNVFQYARRLVPVAIRRIYDIGGGYLEEPASASDSDRYLTREISDALTECARIKPGTTRAELLKTFTTEGGLFVPAHRTFVLRRCPYIKVDVDFDLAGGKSNGPEERPDDKIGKISRPYLGWSIAD